MLLVEGRTEIEDVDRFIERLGEIGAEYETTVQAFDARYIVDRAHLERARELADRAIERGENVARERAMEILLYAAGRRQIEQALELGVNEGETPAVVLIDSGNRESQRASGREGRRPSGCRAERKEVPHAGRSEAPRATGHRPVTAGRSPAMQPDDSRATPGADEGAAAVIRTLLDPEPTLGSTDAARVQSYFDITDAERNATDATLSELVRERVALLDVEK